MNKKQASEIANKLFETYPTVNTFHITSDGQAFENEHAANSHARSLDKKPVVHAIERSASAESFDEIEMVEHVLTAEDFENNKDLEDDPDLYVGDTVQIPVGLTLTQALKEAAPETDEDDQEKGDAPGIVVNLPEDAKAKESADAKAKELADAKKAASVAKAKATKAKNAAAKGK